MTWWLLGILAVFVLAALVVDTLVLHPEREAPSAWEALAWSVLWFAVSLAAAAAVHVPYAEGLLGGLSGPRAAVEFYAGYLMQRTVTMANIFTLVLIFTAAALPLALQRAALLQAVLGMLVLRAGAMAGGIAAWQAWPWVAYPLAGLLLVVALYVLILRHDQIKTTRHPAVALLEKTGRVTADYRGGRWTQCEAGRRCATPLLVVVVLTQTANAAFAVAAVPAGFAVSREPVLIVTATIFSLLGLRSLYYAIGGLISQLRYLKQTLAFVLGLGAALAVIDGQRYLPAWALLVLVLVMLTVGLAACLLAGHRDPAALASSLAPQLPHLGMLAWRPMRKIAVLIAGSTVIFLGVLMIVLPGPALLFIPLGLAILATEFVWARRLLRRAKEGALDLRSLITDRIWRKR